METGFLNVSEPECDNAAMTTININVLLSPEKLGFLSEACEQSPMAVQLLSCGVQNTGAAHRVDEQFSRDGSGIRSTAAGHGRG